MNEQLINEAAVAAALVFKDSGLSITQLEAVAAEVQLALKNHFNPWKQWETDRPREE